MKTSIFAALLLTSSLLLPAPARAEDDTPLAKEMEKVDEAFKGFRRETDPAKGAKAAREAQEGVIKALAFTPALIEKMPAGEAKEKAIVAYRTQMGQLFVTFCQVEAAFVAKDLPGVAKLVEDVKGAKKKGHDEFMEEEE
ncbi:MAG TPA: cytochrome b562 [Haloferula sp.]